MAVCNPGTSRTKPLLWRGLSWCPLKIWERLWLTSVGAGEPAGGTAPRWLWKEHGEQDILLERDDKELLWLFQIVFSQKKSARLNDGTSCFIAAVGASRITK